MLNGGLSTAEATFSCWESLQGPLPARGGAVKREVPVSVMSSPSLELPDAGRFAHAARRLARIVPDRLR